MTNAERQRRKYAKLKERTKAEVHNSIDGTAIQKCFQKAMAEQGKSLKMPAIDQCELIGKHLTPYCHIVTSRTDDDIRQQNTLALFRKCLRHIARDRSILEQDLELIRRLRAERGYVLERLEAEYIFVLEALDGATKNVLAVMDWTRNTRPRRPPWHSTAEALAELATIAWSTVCKPPTSLRHDAPIAIFVSETLLTMGVAKTPSAVSDVLRGRRRGTYRQDREDVGKNEY